MVDFYSTHPKHHVAIDCVIFGFDNKEIKLLVINRSFEPEKGKHSMMGGFLKDREDIDDSEYKIIQDTLENALKEINVFRSEEGIVLEKDFIERISSIKGLLKSVIQMDPDRLSTIRERLEKAVADLKTELDANRFEQELIYYLEKYDITEEKVRLDNHLDYFIDTMKSADSNGKKLGFISQEIGREINTIGSKANYAPMQQLVVQMKDELEKVKEQMLNVL